MRVDHLRLCGLTVCAVRRLAAPNAAAPASRARRDSGGELIEG
jgi:hypothetical protein